MTMLIKSDAGIAVRRFVCAAPLPAEAEEAAASAIAPSDIERAQLLAEIDRLHRRHDAAEDATRRAVEAAREQGRREGFARAERRDADGIAAIRQGVEQARADFVRQLDALDRLAPELACTALAKLFANVDDWAAAAQAMIARQLAALRRSSVVAIRVSAEDFPDAEAVAALSATLAAEGLRVESDRTLRAGASRIECRLGQIDLDARTQWQAVSALLEEMTR
ncbi:hypothetical protein ACG3SL_12910 [Sphingomonas sp. CJ20]